MKEASEPYQANIPGALIMRDGPASPLNLSLSEERCLQALANGFSQKQAADHLGLHVRTFETHIRNARSRIKVKTTYRLLAIAVHFGSVEIMWDSTIEDDCESR